MYPVLGYLSDLSSLLTDLLYDESKIRRSLIIANINISLRGALSSTLTGEFLFEKNLNEILKSAKPMKSLSKHLKIVSKNPLPKQTNTRNTRPSYVKALKNDAWRPPAP